MKRRYILLTVLVLILFFIFNTLKQANAFKEYQNYFIGETQKIESPYGIEDITIDSTNGYAYLSSHNRRNFEERGDIYLYKINDSVPQFINLTAKFKKKNFRPHGISFIQINDSLKYLFVVNHADNQNVIEKFRINMDSLIHLETIADTYFLFPNDIHAVSESEFYITNDHTTAKGFKRTIYDFLKVGDGNVVFYNGKSSKIVAENIAYANGINSWSDKKTFFVASTSTNKLIVFNRLPNNDLEKVMDFDTGIGVDNIEVDYENNLYIGCHPQLLKFLKHAKSATELSPSIVLKMVYIPDSDYKFLQEGIFVNKGELLSGGSVATYYEPQQGKHNDNIILVGAVFEPAILKLKRNFKAQ